MNITSESKIITGIICGLLFFTFETHANNTEKTTLTFQHNYEFDYQLPKQVEKILETKFGELIINEPNDNFIYSRRMINFYKKKGSYYQSLVPGGGVSTKCCKTTNLHFMGTGDFNGDNSEDIVILTKNKVSNQLSLLFFEYIDGDYITKKLKIYVDSPIMNINYVNKAFELTTAAGKGFASSPNDPKKVLISSDYISFYYSIVAFIDDQYQQISISD